ncbi:MAG: class II fructose-bisphosphate aldolase, partial [Gemmatimonadaceae bacterium]
MVEELMKGAVDVTDGKVTVTDEATLATTAMDDLVRAAVFDDDERRADARWLIWEIGQAVGVVPSSIHNLYLARGRGETTGYTVPAINVRGMAYDTARSIFRTALEMNAGAFLLEIARSEIAYTDQRPAEYVAVMMAAALREGWRGPLFIQGDHFQVSAKKFAVDPVAEVDAVKALAREAIAAGFYNIDVDTSTLVDLSKEGLQEQQRANYETAADIAMFVRHEQPAGIDISLGGEIGEVGTENSTVEELHAFMEGFNQSLEKLQPGTEGLSKISVQSGTTHGGVVLADGSIADVQIDFGTLERLSVSAREDYGLAGAVQHGASTLPDTAFHNFPRSETAEIHLATNFQSMLYDRIPDELREEIYAWLNENAADERKPADTDEQFLYKTRKKALGPFKRRFWDLDDALKQTISTAYDEKFNFLFTQLGIADTGDAVTKHVRMVRHHRVRPHKGMATVALAPDDA